MSARAQKETKIGGVPKAELKQAAHLAQTFGDMAKKGAVPTVDDMKQARALVKTIDSKTELHLFQSGIGGGAMGDAEFDRSAHTISRGIETAQKVADHLRSTMKVFVN